MIKGKKHNPTVTRQQIRHAERKLKKKNLTLAKLQLGRTAEGGPVVIRKVEEDGQS